jgi:hypothetical protein
LNPGTFFRLGENSVAVLDSVELTNISVRILSGSVIIECGSTDNDSPIRVTNTQSSVLISMPGLYRFSEKASEEQVRSLDVWSAERSKEIASANSRSADTDAASNIQRPAFPDRLLYPGGILPYGYPPVVGPPLAPLSLR